MTCRDTDDCTVIRCLPLIPAPAHEFRTLLHVFKQAQNINTHIVGNNKKIIITLDMDIYMRAMKLQSSDKDIQSKYIFRIGEFLTVLCALRAIGSSIENSSINEALIQSDLFGPATARQIIEGKHLKRAINAHVITQQSLFQLYTYSFLKENCSLAAQLERFRRCHWYYSKSICFSQILPNHARISTFVIRS